MSKEITLAKGFYADKPREKAPDFVKGRVSINESFIEWFNEHKNGNGYVNIDVLESKDGKWYAKLNDFVPTKSVPSVEKTETESDLPF